MTSLEEVGAEAVRRPYPDVKGCETALVLFGAAFLGGNDGWHIANAGLVATVVDVDRQRLDAMAELYPTDWEFAVGDAFEFAALAATDSYDLVSVDSFTNLTGRCLAELPMWTRIARRMVVVTVTDDTLRGDPLRDAVADGWAYRLLRRTGSVHWAVLQR